MSSNYEWQKHEVKHRVESRLRDAEAHRRAKEANGWKRPAVKWTFSILVGLAIVAAVFLLAGAG